MVGLGLQVTVCWCMGRWVRGIAHGEGEKVVAGDSGREKAVEVLVHVDELRRADEAVSRGHNVDVQLRDE